MEAVILAAGLGKRLKPLSYVFPKPLLRLGDKAIIEYIIDWLLTNNIKDIKIILSGFGKIIESYLGGKYDNISFHYSKPLGTAGQLYAVKKHMKSTFLISYADVITDFEIKPMLDFHISKKSIFTLALTESSFPIRYGIITHDKEGRVRNWEEKPYVTLSVNTGVYIAEPDILSYINGSPMPMNELVKNLLKEKKPVYAYHIRGNFYDIGTYEDYERVNKIFEEKFGNI